MITNTITKARNAISEALRSASADLEEIRDQIKALHSERGRIEREPDDFSTIAHHIDAMIEEAQAINLVGRSILTGSPLSAPALDAVLGNVLKTHPFTVLAHLAPDHLRETLLAPLDRKSGIAPDRRISELDRIDGELLVAEIAEEVVIREMEDATGSYITRRTDADPAILLAPNDELSPPPD